MSSFLNELSAIIKQRNESRPDGSYSTELFEAGLDRILRKVGEEAGEFLIAAKNQDKAEAVNEAADLLFHLMLALEASELSLDQVADELQRRHQG